MLFRKSSWLESTERRLRGKSRRRKSLTRRNAALARFEKLEDRQLLSGVMGSEGMEHGGALALVPADQANFVTAQSGDWSDATTWAGGEVPNENAQVHIAAGHTVVFDTVQEERTEWVRVDGTLQFDHTVDTHLYVETLVVGMQGELIIGTEANPIGADGSGVTARITIADAGEAFDHSVDIEELGRGILSMGRVEMHGADITSYGKLAEEAVAGDTEFVFDGLQDNWNAGDRLVVTGNGIYADEIVTITGISQNDAGQTVVSFDKDPDTAGVQGLTGNHTTPDGYDLGHYVANLERSIVIESENPDMIDRRGHVMFMHNQNVVIENVAFNELGRTDKGKLINDVSTDADGNLVPGTNVRARYPVHFHQAGVSTDATPGHVEGSVVFGSPGWGFVNHDSYVNMIDNVSYNVKGAAFVGEFGNERGTYTRNLAIRTYGGTGNWRSPLTERIPLYDHGFAGHGFWLHSASISLIDNIAAGSGESGFAYWGKGVNASRANLTNFIGNTSFGSKLAMLQWKFLRSEMVLNDFTVWSTGAVIHMPYGHNVEFKDSLFIGNLDRPRGQVISSGYGGSVAIDKFIMDNSTIVGWETIHTLIPLEQLTVRDGYYANITSIEINLNGESGRAHILGNPQFGELTEAQLDGRTQTDIQLRLGLNGGSINLEETFTQKGSIAMFNDQQLYSPAQAPDYVFFGEYYNNSYIPDEFLGKTNQELLDQYGLAPGGSIAPLDSVALPRSNALLGEPTTYVPATLLSKKFTNNLDGYLLKYRTGDGQVIQETEPTQLVEGWNVLTREVDGTKQTVVVFGDITAPVFQEDQGRTIERTIDWSDRNKAVRIGTRVSDRTMGSQKIGFTLRGLGSLRIHGNPKWNNTPYVFKTISYTDKAGNTASAQVKVKFRNAPDELAPYAERDSVTLVANTSAVINVLGNDSDPNYDTLTVESVTQPTHGTVSVTDGQVTYTPNVNYSGTDSFTYQINDGTGRTDSATVNIQVDPAPNNIPELADDVYVTPFEEVLEIPAAGLLSNDSDPDGDSLTASLASGPANGSVTVNADGGFRYTPNAGFSGQDSFTYTADDGNGGVATATARLTVEDESVESTVFTDVALSSSTRHGTVSGSYVDTHAADGTSQTITEQSFSRRRSGLENSWTFNVTGGDVVTFHATAGHNSRVETFRFEYNDGSGWNPLFTLTSQEMTSYSAPLPTSVSGTVTVRVIDTNRARRESSRDAVQIDAMRFESERWAPSETTDILATGESSVHGGSTSNADGSQTLTEERYSRRSRKSRLEHRWTFDLTGKSSVKFVLDAEHLSASDRDDFQFQYTVDGGESWTNLVRVRKSNSGEQSVGLNLPSGTSEVTVRVIDTDSSNDRSSASLRIDGMKFQAAGTAASGAASTPPDNTNVAGGADDQASTPSTTPETEEQPEVTPAPIENLALAGTASQSSTGWGGSASRAIDGNTDSRWSSGTITHTHNQQGAWWQVDLAQGSDIEQIKLWNRSDANLEGRLTNFRVSVYNGATEVFGQDYFQSGHVHETNGFTIDLPEGVSGDRVRVQLNGTGYLSLAEVQVMGRASQQVASSSSDGGLATGETLQASGGAGTPLGVLPIIGGTTVSSGGTVLIGGVAMPIGQVFLPSSTSADSGTESGDLNALDAFLASFAAGGDATL